MSHEPSTLGWIISGFQFIVFLWIWVVVVLLGGLIRSLYRPEPDPIRPPGPIGC
jgi:hypothetical protein